MWYMYALETLDFKSHLLWIDFCSSAEVKETVNYYNLSYMQLQASITRES